jgi:hypothetical protein
VESTFCHTGWFNVSDVFRTIRLAFLIALLSAALSGCRGDATVNVKANETGAGLVAVDVVLDHDATVSLGTIPSEQLLTNDLAASGWAISGIVPANGGGSTIHAERAFASVGQANQILQQLTGPKGALSSFRLVKKRGLTGTTVGLQGTVDLSEGLGLLGDAGLKALTNSTSNLGITDAEVARQVGGDLKKAFTFTMKTDLIDQANTFKVALGSKQRVSVSAKRFAFERLVGVVAVIASLIGLIILALSSRRARNR